MRKRSLIKIIGAGIVASSFTGIAKGEEELMSATEAGVDDEVAALLREGDTQKAKKVLDENNIRHKSIKKTYSPQELVDKDQLRQQEINIESIHDEQSSESFCTLVHQKEDIWMATGTISAEWGIQDINDSTAAADVMALSWDTDGWEPKEVSQDNAIISVTHDGGTWGYPEGDFELYETDGVCASISYAQGISYSGVLQTELIRQNSPSDEMVVFDYKNHFAPLPSVIEGISVGLPIINVTFDNEVDYWHLPASETP